MSALRWRTDLRRNRARRVSRDDLDSNARSLWDDGPELPAADFEHVSLASLPSARQSDPVTSHLAATKVRDNSFLIDCIRGEVSRADRPVSAFDIAHLVLRSHPNRWQSDTVRSAVARARLTKAGFGKHGTGRTQRAVQLWTLGDET
jgi:hypothetical protein